MIRQKKKTCHNLALPRGDFPFPDGKVADLKFRPFSISSLEHVHSFKLEALIGLDAPPDDPEELFRLSVSLAWILSAPLDEVTELALAIDGAETGEERETAARKFRQAVLSFESHVSPEALPALVERARRSSEGIRTRRKGSIPKDTDRALQLSTANCSS